MAAPLKKNSWVDPSKRAGSILDHILENTSEEALAHLEVQSSVEVELQKAPLLEHQSDRTKSRVLFLTRNVAVLDKNSMEQLHFLGLSEVFDEVHIMVLCEAWEAVKDTYRLNKNTWAYTTSVKYWWQNMFAASELADSQLRFSDGFRPDIVVALDPFESGLSGLLIAEKFDREFQVHVTEDFYIPEFKAKSKSNVWRMRIASHVLKRTQSVRVATEMIKTQIAKKFPKINDLALLPRHYDIQAILKATEEKGDGTAFPQFSFVILFVGKLDHDSTLFRAMDASRSILTAKSIGLVVVGDGPNLKEFQKRAEILGIKEQMIFIKDNTALISYLKSANVLLVSDVTEASDETVIKAAAAGLPIIAAHTELRDDLFVDGESAFLCNKDDTVEFSEKLVKFLNANSLRTQFANNARDIIKTRLHEDPNAYKLAFRDSIERVFSEEAAVEEV